MSARLSILALAAFAAASLAIAQDSNDAGEDAIPPEEMVNCVSLSRIDRTEIVDDHTILFYMRGNDIYRNVLPHRCPGLDREEQFMYRVTTSQLCNIDVITVLEDFGSRFMPGASCGLGKFQPISQEMAAQIIEEAERGED